MVTEISIACQYFYMQVIQMLSADKKILIAHAVKGLTNFTYHRMRQTIYLSLFFKITGS